MKRTLALILCLVMLVSLAAGCGSKAVPAGPQTELSGGGSAVPEAEPEKEAENEPWFTFRPKVSSVFLDEIFPAEMVQSWYNLYQAVLMGVMLILLWWLPKRRNPERHTPFRWHWSIFFISLFLISFLLIPLFCILLFLFTSLFLLYINRTATTTSFMS